MLAEGDLGVDEVVALLHAVDGVVVQDERTGVTSEYVFFPGAFVNCCLRFNKLFTQLEKHSQLTDETL